MSLKINTPLVSVDWLFSNLENEHLLILDATILKVTSNTDEVIEDKYQIKNARFFDIQSVFSDVNAPFPNTVLLPEEFEEKAQELGINTNSCIVVYDDLGMYSSPRVWWLFQLMGFKNIAVLNGGFPEWKNKKYPIEQPYSHQPKKGNLKVDYQPQKIKFTNDVLSAIENDKILIADARSKGRFYATEPEPRKGLKGGHIPNSISFPISDMIIDGKLKSAEELNKIFKEMNPANKEFIFSCGSGITAAVLALGAEIAGFKNHAVYDGSWTEWASTENLPIEK
jgi:thiosulfate/3-mercaptopyruvate sulfurtransferase